MLDPLLDPVASERSAAFSRSRPIHGNSTDSASRGKDGRQRSDRIEAAEQKQRAADSRTERGVLRENKRLSAERARVDAGRLLAAREDESEDGRGVWMFSIIWQSFCSLFCSVFCSVFCSESPLENLQSSIIRSYNLVSACYGRLFEVPFVS